jgi:alkanesulfonate monooxygenase SsuD/methylene tetrahydromethanopterin reductase-like flavin-dependent oxidoreductase (luciferase family)
VVTLDRVSGGRVTLGIGVGWLPDEFEYLDVDFADRGRRTDAAIDTIRRLWSEDVIEVHDEHFDFGPVKFNPKPLQKPSIPIEVGGSSKPALRRAGRLGDGWIEIGSRDLDDFTAKLGVVMTAREDAGRAGPFEVTAGAALAGGGLDGYRRLEDAGVTRIMATPPRSPSPPWRVTPAAAAEWAKRFADEVIAYC